MKPTAHDIEVEGLPSASGFDAEFRCLGKRELCKRLPKEKDSPAAAAGHRIHEALKDSDLEGLSESEARTASRIMYGESEIVHEFGFEGAQVTFEERIWDLDEALDQHTWSARIDRYDWQPDKERLLVIDDKSGWTLPPAIHENWQLRSEGSLLTEMHDAKETVVALIHPFHPDSLWEAKVYSHDGMMALLDTTRQLVQAIQQPDQPRTPGGIQCRWCPAKRVCPEYQAWSADLTQAIADEIQDQGFTAINRRSAEERGEHVRALKEQYKNIEFILEQYVALAERDPNAVKGYRLARKLDRHITNEATAIELTRKAFGQMAVAAALKFNLVALEHELADKYGAKKSKELVRDALVSVIQFRKSRYWLEESRSL
jgi:hypothetical protein